MDMHYVRWEGWQAVRPLGAGTAGEVFEIQHYGPAGIESAALKVLQLPREPGAVRHQLEAGSDMETLKQRYHGRMEAVAGAYSLMAALSAHPNVITAEEPVCEPMADGIGWEVRVKSQLLGPVSAAFSQGATEQQVLRLGTDVATALALCQERGFVHEAVKPGNVFVTDEGFCLGDFGSAKATGMPSGGDLSCMCPEAYWGMAYDGRADVYALGLMMYRMLNGGFLPLCYPGMTPEAEKEAHTARLTGTALPAPAMGSPALQALVLQACAYEPAKRFGSALELRAALLQLRGMDPSAALWPVQAPAPAPTWRPAPAMPTEAPQPVAAPTAPVAKPKKNNSNLFLILAVAAALLVVGVVCFFTVHIWSDAACNQVPQCLICGKTADEAQAHQWEEATCEKPETCARCGETQGEALGHQLTEATREEAARCTVCGQSVGQALQPEVWVLKVISNGWQGGHRKEVRDGVIYISFPSDGGFAQSEFTVTHVEGGGLADAFTVTWTDGEAAIVPADGLEPGVYMLQFSGSDGSAIMSVCLGYEGDFYLSAKEHFWGGKSWKSNAHGLYIAVGAEGAFTTDSAAKATVFASSVEMGGLQPAAENVRCLLFVLDGKEEYVAFVYDGKYLACDEKGQLYFSDTMDANGYWVGGR